MKAGGRSRETKYNAIRFDFHRFARYFPLLSAAGTFRGDRGATSRTDVRKFDKPAREREREREREGKKGEEEEKREEKRAPRRDLGDPIDPMQLFTAEHAVAINDSP